jgi:DNA-binding response OmpR family regulator
MMTQDEGASIMVKGVAAMGNIRKGINPRSLKILLIDDEPGIRFGFSRYLSKSGFDVRESGSLADAMDALSKEPFDGIILDVNLPDGSGLDWISGLRRKFPDITIVVMTGSGDSGLAIESILRGADDFLRKPVSMEDLTVCLRRGLHHEL